jgi:hypothetical protein
VAGQGSLDHEECLRRGQGRDEAGIRPGQGSCHISQGFPRRPYGLSILDRETFASISIVGQGCLKTLGNNAGLSRGCPCSRSPMFGKVAWVIFSWTQETKLS